MRKREERKNKRIKKTQPRTTKLCTVHVDGSDVPLSEALQEVSLPLSQEIVGTDPSQGDNEGACCELRGGGWTKTQETKTRDVERCRKLGDMAFRGEDWSLYMLVVSHGPVVVGLGPRATHVPGYTFFRPPPNRENLSYTVKYEWNMVLLSPIPQFLKITTLAF